MARNRISLRQFSIIAKDYARIIRNSPDRAKYLKEAWETDELFYLLVVDCLLQLEESEIEIPQVC